MISLTRFALTLALAILPFSTPAQVPAPAPAQAPVQAQIQIQIQGGNGGVISGGPVIIQGGGLIINRPTPTSQNELGQLLDFADGGSLHGSLQKLDASKKEVLWTIPDASASLAFPLSQILRWTSPLTEKPEIKARTTIKLIGNDWLAADLVDLTNDQLHLKLPDGSPVTIDRSHVEWIYFAKNTATECYEGPQSTSGWASDSSWTYRDGALRSSQSTTIGRMFDTLPDLTEYRVDIDLTGGNRTYQILLHGPEPSVRSYGVGMVRLNINESQLLFWTQNSAGAKQEQVDLSKLVPALAKSSDQSAQPKNQKLRWQIFEDRPAGRLIIFINGRKIGEWATQKANPGENRGSLTFQPQNWSEPAEFSLSNIRVSPWDGFVPVDDAIPNVRPRNDQVILADGEREAGRLSQITADTIHLGSSSFPRDKVSLLRFAPHPNPTDPPATIARVRLTHRGELSASTLSLDSGKVHIRTPFAGDFTLPLTAFRSIDFPQIIPANPQPLDLLLFKNGDQLRGLLGPAPSSKSIRWQTSATSTPVDLDVTKLLGVSLTQRPHPPTPKIGLLARCKNGDLLTGDLLSFEKDRLTIANHSAGRISLHRKDLGSVYFANDGQLPILDGSSEHLLWEQGLDLTQGNQQAVRQKNALRPPTQAGLWSYFDGKYSVSRLASKSRAFNNGQFNLGRRFDAMPPKVEFSFTLTGQSRQLFFSSQLFSEPNRPGYMLQLHPGGLFIYDTGSQGKQGNPQQLQVQFGDKVKADATSYRIRILADRPSGRLIVLVDDVLLANFGPKPGAAPRNLGTGLCLTPQQSMTVSFSDLWVAPWNGQIPGTILTKPDEADRLLLANGDEAFGKILSATPPIVQIDSDLGPLDIPISRLTMAEFNAPSPELPAGLRIRLIDQSLISLTTYHLENDSLTCQSPLLGEIKIPLSSLSEIVFDRPQPPTPTAPPKPLPIAPNPRPQNGQIIPGIQAIPGIQILPMPVVPAAPQKEKVLIK